MRQQQKMYESPAADTVLNADVLAFDRGLDPDDRRAMFERHGRVTVTELIPVRLEMRRGTPGERWKVRDGTIGDPAVATLRLSQVAQIAKVVDPSLRPGPGFRRRSSDDGVDPRQARPPQELARHLGEPALATAAADHREHLRTLVAMPLGLAI